MSLIVQNNSGGPFDINDLGVTIPTGLTLDLSESADPPVIVNSANGGDLDSAITLGNLTVKDPIGGGNLSVADGLAAVRSMNDSNWRHGAGARIGDNSDVVITSLVTDEVLRYNGSNWVNVNPAEVGGSGFFTPEWNFSTTITAADPGNGVFRYNNATLGSVTAIYYDDNAVSGFDLGSMISTMGSGDKIYVQQNSASSKAVFFTLTGSPVDNGGWWTVPVSVDSSGTLHDNNAKCSHTFMQSGTGMMSDEKVKVSATDTTTDYLSNKVVGASDEITLTILSPTANEDLEIGFADNPIIPGSEGITIPTGTTGERPGSPNNGEVRLNETTGQMEYYWNGNWVTFASSGGFSGSIQAYHFLLGGKAEDKWLGSTTAHLFSDEEPYVLPWDVNIVAVGFNNKSATCYTDIEFYKGVKTGASSPFTWTSTRLFTLQMRTARTSYASDLG